MGARAIAAAAVLIVTTGSAHAAEIDAMITTAMKAAVDELAPSFERASGHVLRITYGPSGGLARRLNPRAAAHLCGPGRQAPERLIKAGQAGGGRRSGSRRAARTAASGCWSGAGKPRSGCSRCRS